MFKVEAREGRSFVDEIDVTGWSEEDVKALLAALNGAEAARAEIRRLADDQLREAQSPQARIEAAREEQAEAEEQKRLLERASIETIAWKDLLRSHGRRRIRRLDTKEGLVVVRCPSEQETIDQGLAMADITPAERAVVARKYLASLVVYPSPESKIEEIGKKWPGLWDDLDMAVRLLQSSRADELRPFG